MTPARLRIAVWHNLPTGGGKRAMYDHVRGLVDRGHHVEAWCPPTAAASYLPLSELVQEHVVDLDLEPTPLPFVDAPLGPLRRNLRAFQSHCRAVATDIGSQFDVAFVGTSQTVAAAPLGAELRIPSVLYLQEPMRVLHEASFRGAVAPAGAPHLPWLSRGKVRRAAVRLGRFERTAAAGYDRILVNSRFSRETVLRALGLSAFVCYLGIDTERFHPVDNPPADYLVGVGAFVPEKNIEHVIRAVALVGDVAPPLVWVGNHVYSDAYLDSLRELAADLGVSFTTHCLVSEAELVDVVSGARAMVYAPTLEPFGYSPLEANACGIPVIGAAEGGVRETIVTDANGVVVEPDIESLAAGIAELWNDPARAAALGERARVHTQTHWALGDAIDRLEAHLLQVADASSDGIRDERC